MIGSTNHDQTKTESRDMGMSSRGGGCSRSTPARDERQDRSALRGRAGFACVLISPPRGRFMMFSSLTGRGFGPGVFSHSRRAPVSLAVMRLRRQANVAPPSVRLVASKFLRDLNSGALAFHTADHSPCRVTDLPPVVQFRRLSSLVASDVKHRDREGFRNVRTPFQGARNDF